jgi:integrase
VNDRRDAEWWRPARHVVEFALDTAMRRGEIIGLRWRDVELLERRLHVRETIVRGKVVTPKSRSSRRTMEIGPRTAKVLDEVWQASRYRTDDSFVFGHPQKGAPVDPTKLSTDYMRPALKPAAISEPFRPWHDLRHTALTHEAAAGNPHAYVQAKGGTARARSPTGTSTRRTSSSPAQRRRPKSACSESPGSKSGSKNRGAPRPRTRKAPVSGAFQ